MPTKTPRDWKDRFDELPIYLRSKFSKDCSRGETEEEKSCKMLEYEHVFYLVETLLEEARQEERIRLRPNSSPVLERFEELFLHEDKYSSSGLFAKKYREPGKLGCMIEDIRTFVYNVDMEARQEMKEKCLAFITNPDEMVNEQYRFASKQDYAEHIRNSISSL